MDTVTLVFILALANHAQGSHETSSAPGPVRRCAYLLNVGQAPINVQIDDDIEEDGLLEIRGVIDGQQYVQCSKYSNACYSLWHVDYSGNNSGVTLFYSQGCWEVSGREDCDTSACITDKKPPKAANNTKFCCCTGDFCNLNVSDMYVPANEPQVVPPVAPYQGRSESELQLYVVLGVILGICCILVVVFAIFKVWTNLSMEKPPPDHMVHLMESGGIRSDSYSVDHLKLSAVVGQGKFGLVWKGTVRDQEVAVKIFPGHYRNYFLNERDIYCLPFMDNPSLLTYYGCDERVGVDGTSEYLLVVSYASNGCLQDYLRANTIDWPTFCKMALGVAQGLAHLHTDIIKGDKSKPCVSHRDLNSRNILVRGDMTCCLCDLGFAMKISGSKYYYNGEEQHAETKSISDVGTLRYMAPEVLEGAVNLRDCESSLKQIDVYSLGLVLWELATRCWEFYQGGLQQTPSFSLPFEAEVGHHPTFEQMQVLVSRHKARPLFPDAWRDWPAIKLMRETVEDCWDQDAEARLTALCVEERLHELPTLWDRKKATMYVSGVSPTVNPTQTPPVIIPRVGPNNVESNRIMESEDTGGSVSSSTNQKEAAQESTVSEGTVETMLTLSPTEPPEPQYKNSNHMYQPVMGGIRGPLQPYQGRNPCMERNLMIQARSNEELPSNGNLIDRSFKHTTPHSQSHFNTTPLESQQLVAHDYLNLQQTTTVRPATPIPYVQNVYESNAYSTIPKQPNVPGNGSSVRTPSRWSWGNGLKKLFEKRRFFGRDSSSLNHNDAEDEAKSNLLVRSPNDEKKSPVVVDTQVSLPNNGKSAVTSVMSNSNGYILTSPGTKLIHGEDSGEKIDKSRRPSTLPLVAVKPASSNSEVRLSRQKLDEQFFANGNVTNSTTRLLKDPNSRVKTPGDVPISVRKARGKKTAARFSLYDDRMMTSAGDYADSLSDIAISCSVPSDIDISCVECNGSRTPRNVDIVMRMDKDSSSF